MIGVWMMFGPIIIINQLVPVEFVMPTMSLAFIITGMVYLRKYRSICSSYKFTKRFAKHLDFENFDFMDCDLPLSKTMFGNEVFYCATSGVILPYSMVAWAYVHQMSTYGEALIRRVVVRCRNGTSVYLNIPDNEIVPLIQALTEKCPDMITGYDTEQNKQYKKLVKEFKLNNKK